MQVYIKSVKSLLCSFLSICFFTSNKQEQADDNKYAQINLIQEQKDKH